MAAKTTDWRPGPTVCRCCLSEGCYKDISTEYFWMGKREVYAEMLSETLNLSIAYSTSGGPNSNSRLICEPCISRLRDASDFKRQVQECEKTFMQYLDPGSEPLSDYDEARVEVPVERLETQVKVEPVKTEKDDASDGDGFDDRAEFLDDDDDDLDDQPLTRLATKVPKKESVDLLELLGDTKPAEKRKATTKAKAGPAKKAKTKKEVVKATSSKATKQTEKKKKGKSGHVQIADEGREIHSVQADRQNISVSTEMIAAALLSSPRDMGDEKRTLFRKNITVIIESTTAYPFKYRKGTYMCYYCKNTFLEPEKLREHNKTQHANVQITVKPRKYEPLKMDFTTTNCKLCGVDIPDYANLKLHLKAEHDKFIDCTYGECVLPYKLSKDEYCCQICGKRYEMFLSLHRHMNEHYGQYICENCGKNFVTLHRMVNHARTHERGMFPCRQCKETFPSYAAMYAHVSKVHKSNKRYKCPICDEKFASYKHRVKHLSTVHGEKTAVFPCALCPKVFDLCSRRTAHIRFQHLQERNHVCHECGMKFFSNYELQEHSIKHNGERIYQCDVCKKSYARLKTLREHMRIHNDDRRFVCFVCGQSFIQNCSLKQHMRVHHPAHIKNDIRI